MAQSQKLMRQTKGWNGFGWLGSLRRNPIIQKEFRGRMRSWRTFFNLSFFVGILGVFAVLTYAVSMPQPSYYSGYYGYTSSYYSGSYERLGSNIFSAILIVQIILISLLAPSFTSGVLSGEKERQTYEILLLTLLRPAEIVFGKLLSTLAYLFLLIIAAIPIESIVFLVGGVGVDQLIIGLIVPLVTTLLLGSLGVAWSSILKTTSRASRAAYIMGAVMLLGLPALGIPLAFAIYGYSGGTAASYFLLNWASAFNPGVALIATNSMLIDSYSTSLKEKNAFYYILNGGDVCLSPWLVFVTVSLALSILFIVIAIRNVKPLKTDGDFAPKKKKK